MDRDALKVALAVSYINDDIRQFDDLRLATHMCAGFGWRAFAEDHPDMTAEEIASAAADGFAVEV